jgi:hypothetical protein
MRRSGGILVGLTRDLNLQLDQARTSLRDGGGRPLVNPWVGILFAAGLAVLACALIIGRRLRPVGEGRKIGMRAGEGRAIEMDEETQGVVRSPDREFAKTAPRPKN